MSNETFLISVRQNNDLSDIAVAELRMDLSLHPLHQRNYIELSALAGNSRQYGINLLTSQANQLTGKKVLFLGSSVTLGYGALGESFVDYLWKKTGLEAIKNAENGTTLTEKDSYYPGDSYIGRFKQELMQNEDLDLLVLQLSTNDAQKGLPLGSDQDEAARNTKTIRGALNYVISAAKIKWQCPILIYSNPYFANENYAKMVQAATILCQKKQVQLLDLYHDQRFMNQGELYQADEIHPTRAGYRDLWLPVFEAKFKEILS